ncbi:YihY family inner membrane protein [Vitreoscilla sp. C1]|uniref:YihY family inner membrane protein n=1 Tax=Vitreoscilla sp. (strain C1) TaxID=96942 RepID=UPI000CDC336F|nr:YihY family inner membrane protein [Vitreoscilla sp. C1]AUZ05961.1 YihY family inner membrane protein [Vitreoscilla sp. C1]
MLKSFIAQSWQCLTEQRLWQFAIFILKRCQQLHLFQVSSSLTFTTLLALVPFFTIALTVISAFPMFEGITRQFQDFITDNLVPQASYTIINEYVFGFLDNASKLTTIGIIMLVASAILLINTIETAFNQIWGTTKLRPWHTRLLVYWALLTLGPVILGLTISQLGRLTKQSIFALHYPTWALLLQVSISILVNMILLWLMYRVVPSRYVPAKHALVGALWSAVILEIAKRIFSSYFGHVGNYQVIYGAFAAVPLFLVWINVLWAILLSGAILTNALSYWKGDAFHRHTGQHGRFDDILKILILLAQAHDEGKILPTRSFRNHINMGYDELTDMLEQLQHYDYVARDNDGWLLKTNPQNIDLRAIFELFVYRPHDNQQDQIGQMVQNFMQPSMETLNMSLADFMKHSKVPTTIV